MVSKVPSVNFLMSWTIALAWNIPWQFMLLNVVRTNVTSLKLPVKEFQI